MTPPQPAQLSPSVYLYQPVIESNDGHNGHSPRLVILATWVFALDGHVAKYVAGYQELFPTATILVARSFLRHMFWIPAARQELLPAASVIRNVLGGTGAGDLETTSTPPSLMLHVFSNSMLPQTHLQSEALSDLS